MMTKWFSWWLMLVLPACGTAESADPAGKTEYAAATANSTIDDVATGSTCDNAALANSVPIAPAAEEPSSSAIALDDPQIVAWSSAVVDIDYGASVDDQWKVPERALGKAQGTSTDVVSLGEGGSITLGFAEPIADRVGADFCVFENSFSDTFLEFAFVEVASNADTFVRFTAHSRVAAPVDAYGTLDPTLVDGFAGKYRQGFCTPFDVSLLKDRPEVASGTLDLSQIRYIRLRDIIGDGGSLDCAGRPIYDPYPTTGGAGFDLDAIAVLGSPQ